VRCSDNFILQKIYKANTIQFRYYLFILHRSLLLVVAAVLEILADPASINLGFRRPLLRIHYATYRIVVNEDITYSATYRIKFTTISVHIGVCCEQCQFKNIN